MKFFVKDYMPNIATHAERITKEQVTTQWIDQKLDHFNNSDNREWRMRYLVNDFLSAAGGPLFLKIGGQSEVSVNYAHYGHFRDMAKKYKAYYVTTEHRYYGESRPTKVLSKENLQYLTSTQALADLAHLIRNLTSTVSGLRNSKVIVCGGSYAGSLAILLKNMYQGYVDGVWASGSPLIAKTEFPEIRNNLGNALRKFGSEACYQRIKNGIAQVEKWMDSYRWNLVKRDFHLCTDFNEFNGMDTWTFALKIANSFLWFNDKHDASEACSFIQKFNDDKTGVAEYVLKLSKGPTCLKASYEDNIKIFTDITNFRPYRLWFYQVCNEFGWFPISGNKSEPFGRKYPIGYFTTMCRDAFGTKYTDEYINSNVERTNNMFTKYNNMKNIYMTVGEFDPWRPLVELPNKEVNVIPGVFHCQDLGSIRIADSPEMKASKDRIDHLIGEWIK